jgi:prevent-host-death family protein
MRIRNPRGELVEPAHYSATDAKNAFGRILEHVARDGGVAITRRNEPFAVVIPVATYERLAGAEARTLDTLSKEFDALLRTMQKPGAAAAMQAAFDMTPAQLGQAAIRQAARVAKAQRQAAKEKATGKKAKPRAPA